MFRPSFLLSFLLAALPAPSIAQVVISELYYNPPGAGDFTEFVEFYNPTDSAIELGDATFDGIGTVTLTQTTLPARGYLVLAKLPVSFQSTYGFAPGGSYTGSLNNSVDTIEIDLPNAPATTVTYGDGGDEDPFDPGDDGRSLWLESPDGTGFSLTLLQPDSPELENDDPLAWRRSIEIGGSPGAAEPIAAGIPPIVINEARTRDGALSNDAVELYNPTTSPVDVADWFLTDNLDSPQKLALVGLGNTVIPAGGYLTISLPANNFSLSSQGERIFLFSGANALLTGYVDGFHFGPSADGLTFSRTINADGRVRYPQARPTLGAANASPAVGPVVITEFLVDPADGSNLTEFIEITNISSEPVPLYDPENPQNNWRVEGVNFILTGNQPTLQPGESALVVGVDPELFGTANNIPITTRIFGPFTGALNNGGEAVGLQRPENLDDEAPTLISYITVDETIYSDSGPWAGQNASGVSLTRISQFSWPDQSTSWQNTPIAPTPGSLGDDYLLWAHRTFPTAALDANANAPISATEDFDDDGFNNLFAYALGLSPTTTTAPQLATAANAPQLTFGTSATAASTFTFATRTNLNRAADYFPETTDDLTLPTWQQSTAEERLSPAAEAEFSTTTFTPAAPTSAETRRFFRLRVAPRTQ